MYERKWWKLYNKRILVDSFQLRFLIVAIVHFMIVVGIFVGALYAPIIIELKSGELSSPEVQKAAHEFLVLHSRLWLPLLGAFILLVLHNIMLTHRIAGPLFRFRRFLAKVGAGDLSSTIQFRKDDYLGREAQAASQMVESLREKIEYIDTQLQQTTRLLDKTPADSRSGMSPQTLVRIDEHMKNCRDTLDSFKTRRFPKPAGKQKTEAERVSEEVTV